MKDVKDYLLRGTPSHLLPLGAGFVMASSNDIRAAIGMGIAVLLSMLLSAFTISLVKKLIPACAKLPAYVLIMTGYVTLIDMLKQAQEKLGLKLIKNLFFIHKSMENLQIFLGFSGDLLYIFS